MSATTVIGILVQVDRLKNSATVEVAGSTNVYNFAAEFANEFFDEFESNDASVYVGEPVELKLTSSHLISRILPRLTITPKKSRQKTFNVIEILSKQLDGANLEASEPSTLSPENDPTSDEALNALFSNELRKYTLPASPTQLMEKFMTIQSMTPEISELALAMMVAVQRASALPSETERRAALDLTSLVRDAKLIRGLLREESSVPVEEASALPQPTKEASNAPSDVENLLGGSKKQEAPKTQEISSATEATKPRKKLVL